MRQVWLDGGADGVTALTGALAEALDGGDAVLPLSARDPAAPALAEAMRPGEPVEPHTALVVATSGSTGAPKGVLLSAEALLASAEATHARLGGPGRWLLATPAQYIGGIQVLVRSLLAGTTPAVLDLGAGFRPDEFTQAARPVLGGPGPRYTALVPTQLARLLDAGGRAVHAARAFDAIVLGGAATPRELKARAHDAGIAIVSAYGMSETAGGCVYDGIPLDGVRIRQSGEDGRQAGPVLVAGPVLAHGYRGDPALTASAFRDGWFATSDLGRLTEDGRLEILGRADDVINTGGVKVAAAAVERALLEHPAVREACVLGLPHPDWGETVAAAVVARDPEHPPAPAELTLLVRRQAGAPAVPKVLRFLPELPLRGPGKVDRAAVKAVLGGSMT